MEKQRNRKLSTFFKWPFSIVMFVSFCLFHTTSSARDKIRFCYENQEYLPYIKGNTTTPENKPGILVDIASAASKAVNLTPEFIRRPWKRCIEELRKIP